MVIVSTLVGDVMDTLTAWVETAVMNMTVPRIRWCLHLHSVVPMNSGKYMNYQSMNKSSNSEYCQVF